MFLLIPSIITLLYLETFQRLAITAYLSGHDVIYPQINYIFLNCAAIKFSLTYMQTPKTIAAHIFFSIIYFKDSVLSILNTKCYIKYTY